MRRIIRTFLIAFLLLCVLTCFPLVRALSKTPAKIYKNNHGVVLTEEQYNIIIDMYGKNYFYKMTADDYEWFEEAFTNGTEIEMKFYDGYQNNLMGMTHSTDSKKISILKSCSSTKCTVITTVKWLKNPKVRSYDVIGTRFNGTNLAENTIITRVLSSNGVEYFNNLTQYSNGFGVSVKLPTSATDIVIDQKFYVTSSGTVYASYQHATKTISLATSKLFTIDSSGYGKVFNFYGNAQETFDGMGGVDITLN